MGEAGQGAGLMGWEARDRGQGWMRPGPGAYLGAVLSHGVVVEAGLGLKLLPAVLALESVLQLWTRPHL